MRYDNSEINKTSNYSQNINSIINSIEDSDIYSQRVFDVNIQNSIDVKESSDDELVEIYVLYSDETAFNELAERYSYKIRALAIKILRDASEAEEVVQDVLLILVQNICGFRGESKFSTWLYAISINEIKRRYRERSRKNGEVSIDGVVDINTLEEKIVQAHHNNHLKNPEEIYINKEFTERFHEALEQIPEKYKEVFVLRDLKQHTNEEVATELGLSLAAVKSRIHRARHFIKINLSKEYGNPGCTK